MVCWKGGLLAGSEHVSENVDCGSVRHVVLIRGTEGLGTGRRHLNEENFTLYPIIEYPGNKMVNSSKKHQPECAAQCSSTDCACTCSAEPETTLSRSDFVIGRHTWCWFGRPLGGCIAAGACIIWRDSSIPAWRKVRWTSGEGLERGNAGRYTNGKMFTWNSGGCSLLLLKIVHAQDETGVSVVQT